MRGELANALLDSWILQQLKEDILYWKASDLAIQEWFASKKQTNDLFNSIG